MKVKVGLIRVITTQDDEVLNSHKRLLESRFPDISVETRCIEDQPQGIHNQETCAIAVPKILKLGQAMEQEGVSAILVSCADDPGVKELRKCLNIPVIGAGSACACLALSFGTKVAAFGIAEHAPHTMKTILGEHLCAEIQPEGVHTTLDLMTAEGKRSALETAVSLGKRGVDVIALACTGYSTIGIAPELEQAAGIPVIDAVEATGLITWHFTRHIR